MGLVDGQSSKLFLGAFRDHGAFAEDRTLAIARRLEAALEPLWLRIGGYRYPRGGMPVDVSYPSGAPRTVSGYRTRGCHRIGPDVRHGAI